MTVREEDVLDCDVVHQSHVSAHLFLSLPTTCESLGGQLFRTTLTLGRFASSLYLCLCLSKDDIGSDSPSLTCTLNQVQS